MAKKFDFKMFLSKNIVPIIFLLISAVMAVLSGLSPGYIVQDLVSRLGRNAFLVLSLLIPLIAGMGINFGLALGACAGQIALILVTDWHIVGAPGMFLAMLISIPISIVLGIFGGYLLNNARGREMITAYVLGLFMIGVYQIVVLFGMGRVIPIQDETILLSRGFGIRNTIKLDGVSGSFDALVDRLVGHPIQIGSTNIPVFSFVLVAVLCLLTWWFRRTKLGQEVRAVGQDMGVSAASGINVNRTRIIAMVISTVLAGFGQLIWLQNIDVMTVYTGANSVALYAAAALLVGGASANKAGISRVIVGTGLFHLLFIVMPLAGVRIFGMSAIAEQFRVFVSYSVIAVALVINAWSAKKEKDQALFGHRTHVGDTASIDKADSEKVDGDASDASV
ncbi:MAG: ABC transporter permease [Oscillospiraceae bacterium]|nr:ABC transporter permease [Oscillospiraceae bacterium]